jgi:hypothetical protein
VKHSVNYSPNYISSTPPKPKQKNTSHPACQKRRL